MNATRNSDPFHGRGASANPAGRFEVLAYDRDPAAPEAPPTRFLRDATRSIIAHNDSPDVGFDISINPYRGCEHGCIYCYARPNHEYLGFSAGLDFESTILVKTAAPLLLRRELSRPGWTPRMLGISGVTDPYQPGERRFRLTRACLEVLADARHPVGIVTKSGLITRDLDLLRELNRHDAVAVAVSVTTLDPALARVMEPRAASPERRLNTIRSLAEAGIPVTVLVAPVVPGLTDHEIPAILEAVAEAGAHRAAWLMLRLPYGVKALFAEWLSRHFPDRRDKVLNRIRAVRGGELNQGGFHQRMRGEGIFADQIAALFAAAARRTGLDGPRIPLSAAGFRRPGGGQLRLFDD